MRHSTGRSRAILIVAPTGRDARLAHDALSEAGLSAHICPGLAQLRAHARANGAGALLIAEEATAGESRLPLCRFLDHQAPWSRLPVILLARPGKTACAPDLARALESRCSLTILERPLSRGALVSAASVAVQARVHQYDIRDHIEARERHVEALRRSVEERDVLLAEVHHRVRNNLQMVLNLLELEKGKLPDVAQAVRKQSIGRIQAMAMVHELLYRSQDFGRFALDEYLRRLTDVLAGLADPPLQVDWATERLELGLGHAVPLALIAQEVVVNAIKHGGGDPRLRIAVCRQGDEAELTISDHGLGLPDGVDPLRNGSMGGRLIRGLASQIQGHAAYEPGDGGTTFVLRFPLNG